MDPLIERARAGDAVALGELLAQVAPSVHRFGMRMCRNAHDAEDVLQDALLAMATHLQDFEGRSSLSSWAFALTRSACARRRRGMKNRPASSAEDIPEEADRAPSPEQSASDRQLAGALSVALDALSDEYREVIQLRDIEGLSAAETAEAIGVSVDAVKSRLHRAREALREELRPVLEPHVPPPSSLCPDVMVMWSRKLEGDLSHADCAQMEEHIKACASCGAACDALREALLACRRAGTGDVGRAVQQRVKAALVALGRFPPR
jgi:RNA polymerase sigma-70 factor (ECF subfamily)